jgi:hypothetical protein
MLRFLTAALLCEGRQDEAFLTRVISRQLSQMACGDPGFDFEAVVPRGCLTATGPAQKLDAAVCEASEDFALLLVHNDYNERGKIDALRDRTRSRLSGHSRIVGVIPIRETEAWALADSDAFPRGCRLDGLPRKLRDIEADPDPKIVLKAVLGRAYDAELADYLGENVSLDRLAQFPAYQLFLQDLTTALKELNFQ